MPRKEDWPERLHEAIRSLETTPFVWGSSDCLMNASTLIQAITGVDPGAAHRGTYSSLEGALQIVTAAGCADIEAFVTKMASENGYQEIGVKFASRGDLVIFDSPDGPAYGVVAGVEAIVTGPNGLRKLPTLTARKAWRVA